MSWEGIQDWRIQETILRFQMIAPLLEEGIDKAKRNQLYRDIAEQNGLSPRTIRRYEEAYLEGGTEGLIPMERPSKGPKPLPENFGENLRSSIELRSELPDRSVAMIIKTLELEGKATPGKSSGQPCRGIFRMPGTGNTSCNSIRKRNRVLPDGSACLTG